MSIKQTVTNKRMLGAVYEAAAARYLSRQGCLILETNFRCREGEIDIIAMENNFLIFVEVRYRSSKKGGGALASVNKTKQKKICHTAICYLACHIHRFDIPCRFDVIGIEGKKIYWVKNAFPFHRTMK